MIEARTLPALAAAFWFLAVAGRVLLEPGRPQPPHGLPRMVVERYGLQDTAFLAGGYRRLAADTAWVQFLLYLAGALPDDLADDGIASLRPMALRVTRLDPTLATTYIFAAGILAWRPGVNRVQEAADVLREGIALNPGRWDLAATLAAIGYREAGQMEKVASELEPVVRRPDCPAVIKSILASTYESLGRYREAADLWVAIVESPGGEGYRDRAERKLAVLARKAREARQ